MTDNAEEEGFQVEEYTGEDDKRTLQEKRNDAADATREFRTIKDLEQALAKSEERVKEFQKAYAENESRVREFETHSEHETSLIMRLQKENEHLRETLKLIL